MVYVIGVTLFILGFICHATISARAYEKGYEDGLEYKQWLANLPYKHN